jgi:hypothetical protein
MDINCSELSGTERTPHEIALARCDCLMDRYLRWKLENHKKSVLAQRVALVLTSLTPVLLLLPWEYVNILAAAASALAAIATGYLAISGWRENFVRYGYTWHALQNEKFLYLTRAADVYSFDDDEVAARHFHNRIEQLVMAEVTDWRTYMQPAQPRSDAKQ